MSTSNHTSLNRIVIHLEGNGVRFLITGTPSKQAAV
jgi:hypothetical protein